MFKSKDFFWIINGIFKCIVKDSGTSPKEFHFWVGTNTHTNPERMRPIWQTSILTSSFFRLCSNRVLMHRNNHRIRKPLDFFRCCPEWPKTMNHLERITFGGWCQLLRHQNIPFGSSYIITFYFRYATTKIMFLLVSFLLLLPI